MARGHAPASSPGTLTDDFSFLPPFFLPAVGLVLRQRREQTHAALARWPEQSNSGCSPLLRPTFNQTMKNKLVVVTDLAALKAYQLHRPEPGSSPRLDLLEAVELNGAHEKMTDQVSDLGGRFGKGGGLSNGTSAGERHNFELEHRKRPGRVLQQRVVDPDADLFAGDQVSLDEMGR